MNRSWRLRKDAMFRYIGRDLFLIQFQDEIERDEIMLKDLWNFDNELFLLREIQGSAKPSNIELKEATFWFQVYDLLLMPMREGVARRIGSAVVSVEEVESKDGEDCVGQCIRIKITIDITKHLLRDDGFRRWKKVMGYNEVLKTYNFMFLLWDIGSH